MFRAKRVVCLTLMAAFFFGPLCCASGREGETTTSAEQKQQAGQELPPMRSRGNAAILSVVAETSQVPRFEKFELTIELSASYDNPFDPEQIDLSSEFISPSGKRIVVPGFFYQAYRNRNGGDDQKTPILDAVGEPCWKVRFAPTEVGTYRYTVGLRNRFGAIDEEVKSKSAEFECVASVDPGFIRISPANHRYFQFDDGTPFFAVGQNLQNDWTRYHHFRLLAESGCNAVRIWIFCHWSWLEWTFKPDIPWANEGHWMRSYAGAGKYNQRIAWIADHHLAQCERDGLRLMLCLGNAAGAWELGASDRYDAWGGHPYNVANGGFLKQGNEFWVDERARRLYKQRLRYIIARYSYSTSVWAWEFWNELGEAGPKTVAWHREMGEFVRQIDPARHLITTSTWTQEPARFNAVWDLPQMDFTQTHVYQGPGTVHRRVGWALRDHPTKPHVVGEGGGPAPSRDAESTTQKVVVDPDGIDFHNSLWAATMSGAAGTTLPWWWRQRIEPNDLFFHYTAIARFVEDVSWTTARREPANPLPVSLTADPKQQQLSPVMIVPAGSGWGGKLPRNRFVVEPDGAMPHVDDFSCLLFGSGRAAWRNPPTIEVDYPAPGSFCVYVSETSRSILEILLDGKLALRDDSLSIPRKQIRKGFTIDVPAGKHEVTLRNTGGDWLRIGHLLLGNYRDATQHPDVDAYALQSDTEALLWIHHRLNEWAFRDAGIEARPIAGAKLTLSGWREGAYRVEWWDTYRGEITHSEERTHRGGSFVLDLPVIRTDVACKISRVR